MADQAPHGLCFYKILMPDFSVHLKLPCEIMEQENKKGARIETATLKNPNGSIWEVDIYRGPRDQLYLSGDNWNDFIVANKLGVSNVLVFQYKGNMVFSFRAFGSCMKEISYISPGHRTPIEEMEKPERKGLRFFRFLLKDFPKKLMLPDNLADPNIEETRREVATLITPNGSIWTVKLVRGADEVYIGGERWRDFTLANKLRVGDLLVFHHKGNMAFSLKVFDSNTKEISYSLASAQKGHKMKENIESYNAARRNPSMPLPQFQHMDAETPLAHRIKRERDEDADVYVRRSSSSEKLVVEVTEEASNCCPQIPAGSGTLYSLLKEREEAAIIDPEGQTWTIGLLHCTQNHTTYFSNGWSEFASANEVKEGTKCVFQLVQQADADKLLMSVEIHRTPSEIRFQATCYASNFKYMNVPLAFLKAAGMKDYKEAVLRDPKGRLWKVGINCRIQPTPRAEISTGWRPFARANQLNEGDRCTFVLVSEGNNKLLQVEIIKAANVDSS